MKNDMSESKAGQFGNRMKAAWGLTDEEVALFASDPEEFYEALREKRGINRNDAEKKIQEMWTSLRRKPHAA